MFDQSLSVAPVNGEIEISGGVGAATTFLNPTSAQVFLQQNYIYTLLMN